MTFSTIARYLSLVAGVLGQDMDDEICRDRPGGCPCFYDALRMGCPSSLGHDSKMMLCGCTYDDNTWLNVLTKFRSAFKTAPQDRHMLTSYLDVRMEPDGTMSLDAGYTQRLQCGAPLTQVYPGSKMELDIQQLYQLAGNILYPEVHNEMNRLCVPGRLALGLLCLHAELGRGDGQAAKLYAKQMKRLWEIVGDCAESRTPFPFPGLGEYLTMWKKSEVPNDRPLSKEEGLALSWFPEASGKSFPEPDPQNANHYWPCAPLKDPQCFPAGEGNLYVSCAHCCDPAKGPTGDPACFDGFFTFARCCRTPGDSGRFY